MKLSVLVRESVVVSSIVRDETWGHKESTSTNSPRRDFSGKASIQFLRMVYLIDPTQRSTETTTPTLKVHKGS